MEIIRLRNGEVQKLARDFRKSLPTVRKALRGDSQDSIGRMLRKAAMERGGILFRAVSPAGFVPDCETSFDHENKTITQHFGDRVHLIAELETGTVTFYTDGMPVYAMTGVTLAGLSEIQREAQKVADSLK